MEIKDIETIVRAFFKDNYRRYPESYPLTATGLMSEEGTMQAQNLAKDYWTNRNKNEIERDEKAGVTEIDYVEWVMSELSDLIPAAK
jgi:hypothetical protein